MQADKNNMERMVEVVPDSDWQALQNFLSHSPWSGQGLLDQVARDANHLIGSDAFYGDDPEFLRRRDQMEETYILDIHTDQTIYLNDPAHYIPPRKSSRGRRPTRLKPDQVAVEVSQRPDEQPKSAWEKMFVRHGAKGFIFAEFFTVKFGFGTAKDKKAHKWHLVVSEPNLSKNNRKYSLSNTPSDTPRPRLVYMQGQ